MSSRSARTRPRSTVGGGWSHPHSTPSDDPATAPNTVARDRDTPISASSVCSFGTTPASLVADRMMTLRLCCLGKMSSPGGLALDTRLGGSRPCRAQARGTDLQSFSVVTVPVPMRLSMRSVVVGNSLCSRSWSGRSKEAGHFVGTHFFQLASAFSNSPFRAVCTSLTSAAVMSLASSLAFAAAGAGPVLAAAVVLASF